jgi:hypothetical protein
VNLFWFGGHGRAAIEQNWPTSSGVRVAGPRHRNTPLWKTLCFATGARGPTNCPHSERPSAPSSNLA